MSIAPYPDAGSTVLVRERGAGVVLSVDEAGGNVSVVLEQGEQITVPVTDLEYTEGPEPFASFECTNGECKQRINIYEHIEPGQAAVETCSNCGKVWVLVLPPIEIYAADKYPPIWPKIAQ